MAVQFRQLTKRQQAWARELRDRAHAVGIQESVSQIAKDLHGWEQRIEEAERAARAAAAKPAEPSAEELLAERERLLARLAEIDALLPEPEGTTVGTREAAQILGVSVRTVQRWAAAGKVSATKDNGRWVITITIGGN